MGEIHVHEFISLDGVIDTPSRTFDYGLDPGMGEVTGRSQASCWAARPNDNGVVYLSYRAS